MRIFRKTHAKGRKSKVWYVEITDHTGKVRRKAGFESKAATWELGRRIKELIQYRLHCITAPFAPPPMSSQLAEWIATMRRIRPDIINTMIEWDLVEDVEPVCNKPLDVHLEAWKAHLQATSSEKNADDKKLKLDFVIEDLGWEYFEDIDPTRLSVYLEKRRAGVLEPPHAKARRKKISQRTSNHYLQACKQFCRWMVRHKRTFTKASPLDGEKALKVTEEAHARRALSIEEMRTLIAVTARDDATSGPQAVMCGRTRALVYRFALHTGLRLGEIRKLKVADLAEADGVMLIQARRSYTKNNKASVITIVDPRLIEDVRLHVSKKTPAAPIFRFPRVSMAKWLKKDLTRAGIKYQTEDGFVDFHALRHTFCTNVVETGADVGTAQSLMRHGSPTMTLKYFHARDAKKRAALANLPSLEHDVEDEDVAAG